jgi:tetratricopeptide (TPR) repeat protein
MRHFFVFLLIVVTILSCRQKEKPLLLGLKQAESLMQQHPDSALAILKAMEKPAPSDKLNNVTWCLLVTQAEDKNYVRHTSDSLITVALNYFGMQGDLNRKAQTLFYAGQVYNDLKDYEKASACYIRAKDLATKLPDYRLRFLISGNLGMLYAYRKTLKEDAKQELREAYSYALLSRDSSRIAGSLCTLGRVYSLFGQWDSVAWFYDQAIQIAGQAHDKKQLAVALSEVASAYEKLAKPQQALRALRSSMKLERDAGHSSSAQAFLSLGSIFRSINKPDSAVIYLNKALNTSNLYTIRDTYWQLYRLYKKNGQYQKALVYDELYREYADSVRGQAHSIELKEIQERYNNEKLANENSLLRIRHKSMLNTLLLVIIIILLLATALLFWSHRKLMDKERLLQKIKAELQTHLAKLQENEETIKKNEATLKKLVQQQNRLSRTGAPDEIEAIHRKNSLLQGQNELLSEKIKAYTQVLQEKELKLASYKKLQKQNEKLSRHEQFLLKQLEKQFGVLKTLRRTTKPIDENEWPEIVRSINLLNNNFTQRLQKLVPSLSEQDIRCCCLIKLRLQTASIAGRMAVSPASVTKRKQRIRKRIAQNTGELSSPGDSLDDFIVMF